jgi:molybdopterin-guanine dinucleotide biosynthesis protein A|tara:strand:- start:33 stop:524 length:492 start_codon:yes stop_codon:yes gene_type:complete
MGLDQYAHLRSKNINWEKYYSDDEEERKEEAKHVFVWRKHARLQTFFARKWREQNEAEQKKRDKSSFEAFKKAKNPMDVMSAGLGHLGFNAGDEVYITDEVVKDLEETFKNDYRDDFCSDGFFWGQQFQEEAVREYKAQDTKFIEWCKEQIKNKQVPIYRCSW